MESEIPKENDKLRDAVRTLSKALKNDPELFYAYQANIAMAFKDNVRWYKQKTGKKSLSSGDLHEIANDAAKYFLNQFCK